MALRPRYPGSVIARYIQKQLQQLISKVRTGRRSRSSGEPSRAYLLLTKYEGPILAGVFISWLLKLAADIYVGERFEEGYRKSLLESHYQERCRMSEQKIQQIQETLQVYKKAHAASKQRAEEQRLVVEVHTLYARLLELQQQASDAGRSQRQQDAGGSQADSAGSGPQPPGRRQGDAGQQPGEASGKGGPPECSSSCPLGATMTTTSVPSQELSPGGSTGTSGASSTERCRGGCEDEHVGRRDSARGSRWLGATMLPTRLYRWLFSSRASQQAEVNRARLRLGAESAEHHKRMQQLTGVKAEELLLQQEEERRELHRLSAALQDWTAYSPRELLAEMYWDAGPHEYCSLRLWWPKWLAYKED